MSDFDLGDGPAPISEFGIIAVLTAAAVVMTLAVVGLVGVLS